MPSANPNWTMWTFNSLAHAMKEAVSGEDTDEVKVLVEGVDDRDDAFLATPVRVEVRVNGPFVHTRHGEHRIYADGNVLLSQDMESDVALDKIDDIAGIYLALFDTHIPVFKYGDDDGEFFGSNPDTDPIGCLRVKLGKNDTIDVFQFGIIEQNDSIRQVAVDCRFEMYL